MLKGVDRSYYKGKGEKFLLERVARYLDNYIGEEGNAWNDENTGEGGISKVVDIENLANICIMGVVHGGTDLKIYTSTDKVKFYYDHVLSQEFVSEEIPEVPDWESSTNYKVGDMVGYEYEGINNIYTCIENHRSGNNFEDDEGKWDLTYEDVDPEDKPEEFTFHIKDEVVGRYIQIQSANNVRATATIIAKP